MTPPLHAPVSSESHAVASESACLHLSITVETKISITNRQADQVADPTRREVALAENLGRRDHPRIGYEFDKRRIWAKPLIRTPAIHLAVESPIVTCACLGRE